MRGGLAGLVWWAVAAGCALAQPPIETVSVPALGETAPVGSLDDAADDPAIWRDRRNPERSLIVGTDKKAGLQVYDLSGALKFEIAAGLVNNVDLRDGAPLPGGSRGVLVAASDRTDLAQGHLALFSLTPGPAPTLAAIGRLPIGAGEAYGFCLWRRARDQALFAITPFKDGVVRIHALDLAGAAPAVRLEREVRLATQPEGCVADDRTGILYVGEEGTGVWSLDLTNAASMPQIFAMADGARLVADVEGLALAPRGRAGGMLIVSSQGDNAYAVYRLRDAAFLGRFRIAANGNGVDGTYETDGIELALGGFGPAFPEGLFVAQDGDNAPEAQNFKLASWADVRRALSLAE